MSDEPLVEHLFRHQFGKMVSVLTRIFGLSNLEMIEDAVQDTFVNALTKWRIQAPDDPEAWLMQAAKNRMVDLFRKTKAENKHTEQLYYSPGAHHLNELLLDHEIEDAQLRMIFVACHPALKPEEQIAFALRSIAGFNIKEIAVGLLLPEETVKKRLQRARKKVVDQGIEFAVPSGAELLPRFNRVMDVIYIIFNEGFQSTHQAQIIKKDLCGEALRLCQLLLKRDEMRSSKLYALFALLCFHSSRLDTKISPEGELIDLEHQDRTQWFWPLIKLGNEAMNKAMERDELSTYYFEAAIAGEHIKARTFAETDWDQIAHWYACLLEWHDHDIYRLNLAYVHIQQGNFANAERLLLQIPPKNLADRQYLLFGTWAELHKAKGDHQKANASLKEAIEAVTNDVERRYLRGKLRG
ncbi:MAG: sigma-70 family RNA polymerase sigma factor [Flavobacteriales bacterium]|nr:sigma-70 family RNA polymerase sigma factor [Flavobacteriales bacterium]